MDAPTIVVGTFTRSLLIHVARVTGKWDAVGLRVDERSVTSSPAQFASAASGEYDLILTGPDNVLAYRFVADNPLGRILPVEILAGIDGGLGLGLWAAPGGGGGAGEVRRVGVDVAVSGFAFLAYGLLARAGVAPGSYEVVALGATPRRAAALVAGECDVTILNAGNELRAGREGCGLLASVTDYGPYLGTVLAGLPVHEEGRKRMRESFRAVLVETISELLAGRHRDVFLRGAQEVLGLTADEAEQHHAVAMSAEHGYLPGGVIPRERLATLVELRNSYGPGEPILDGIPRLESLIAEGGLR